MFLDMQKTETNAMIFQKSAGLLLSLPISKKIPVADIGASKRSIWFEVKNILII